MIKTFSILTLVFIGLASCEKNTDMPESDFINVLKNSPETIEISDNSLSLKVSLSRDFMPVCEEDGRPLYCVVGVYNSQGLDLDEEVSLKKIYVINGERIWSSKIKKSNMISEEVYGFADNGPKWGPNITVDVVCEFEYKGLIRRIISKAQNIILTE